jgi:hypothetical protein
MLFYVFLVRSPCSPRTEFITDFCEIPRRSSRQPKLGLGLGLAESNFTVAAVRRVKSRFMELSSRGLCLLASTQISPREHNKTI